MARIRSGMAGDGGRYGRRLRGRVTTRTASLRRSAGLLAVLISALAIAATGQPARAASATVNLDQWASLSAKWQNGDLNGTNTRYPEGGAVPFRLAIEGLQAGTHDIHLDYDFTAGGHKAYDFLTSWNAWRAPDLCALSGGAISSMCPSLPVPSTAAFPTDPFAADGLTVAGAQAYSGAPRRLTIFGGTIISIGPVVHSGPVGGNSTADMVVRFRSSGSAVLLVWAGHLAQSTFWNLAAGGSPDGAGQVSGAPWHMRTLQLDGSGNRNQDRSIQPSAIVGEVPPGGLAPAPTPTPARPTLAAPKPASPTPSSRVDSPTQAIPPDSVPTMPATATEPTGPSSAGDEGWLIVPVAALAAFALVLFADAAVARRRGDPRPRGRWRMA